MKLTVEDLEKAMQHIGEHKQQDLFLTSDVYDKMKESGMSLGGITRLEMFPIRKLEQIKE